MSGHPRPIALTGGSTELVEGQPKPEPDPIIPGTAAAPSLTTSRLDGWLGSRRPLSPATSRLPRLRRFATSRLQRFSAGNRIRCRRRSRPSLGDTPAAAQFSSPAVPSNEISSPACAVDYWFTDSLRLLQRQRLFCTRVASTGPSDRVGRPAEIGIKIPGTPIFRPSKTRSGGRHAARPLASSVDADWPTATRPSARSDLA